ncbi:MAG: DUF1801 domain-containing protein [Bacteroidota bacterium]
MNSLALTSHPDVAAVFNGYPPDIKPRLEALRTLILETADELNEVTSLEETLKWGEPSYISNVGSTVRMDWKPRFPDQYALFFSCSTILVSTFKEVYGGLFTCEKNRAIWFHRDTEIPVEAVRTCIVAALRYKKVKDVPYLGMVKE